MKPFTERKKGEAGIGLWEEENEFSLGSVVSRVYSFSSGDVHRQINGEARSMEKSLAKRKSYGSRKHAGSR